jgi:UDP-N-acetylmuramoylalanine--D-glutamate ligase
MEKVAVIGMGKSGRSAATLLQKKGHQVVCFDQKNSEGVVPDSFPYDFTGFKFAVLSPGIPDSHLLVQLLERNGIEIISEIELAFRCMPLNKKIVGITGTNGKTSVTEMITHSLNFLGIQARAAGNIGYPLTEALDQEGVLVVELSSFQLEKTFRPALDVAVVLRITPDHLDRYATFVDYAEAKMRIAHLVKQEGMLIMHRETARMFPNVACDKQIGWGDCNENQQATIAALSYFGKTHLEVMKALSTFKAPPHRMEWIREINGIHFYNDSKATNVDSVLYALKSMSGPIHLIAGGKHKGSPYTPWKPLVEEKVEKVYLIGEAAEEIAYDLHGSVSMHVCNYLDRALELAIQEAKPGDKIVLSPGCSSFDQFKNYEERGLRFKQLVAEIKLD